VKVAPTLFWVASGAMTGLMQNWAQAHQPMQVSHAKAVNHHLNHHLRPVYTFHPNLHTTPNHSSAQTVANHSINIGGR